MIYIWDDLEGMANEEVLIGHALVSADMLFSLGYFYCTGIALKARNEMGLIHLYPDQEPYDTIDRVVQRLKKTDEKVRAVPVWSLRSRKKEILDILRYFRVEIASEFQEKEQHHKDLLTLPAAGQLNIYVRESNYTEKITLQL